MPPSHIVMPMWNRSLKVVIKTLRMLALATLITCASRTSAQTSSAAQGFRFGDFEASFSGLGLPSAAAVASDGTIYVADAGTHQILAYTRGGDRLREIGALGEQPGQFRSPMSVAVSDDGLICVADTGNDRVQVMSPAGKVIHTWGTRGRDNGQFCSPQGIAVSGDRIVVADTGNQRVQVFSPDGQFIRALSGDQAQSFRRPVAVALDEVGNIVVVDADRDAVSVFDDDGRFIRSFGDFGPFAGLLNDPQGVACYGGQILLADTSNHRVQFFDDRGEMKKQWGVHDPVSHEGNGRIHYPHDVTIAPDGGFAVICEPLEHRCQVFSAVMPGMPEQTREANVIADQTHFGQRLSIDGRLMLIPEPEHQFIYVLDLVQETPIMINQSGLRGTKFGQFIRPTGLLVNEKERTAIIADPSLARLQTFSLDFKPDAPLKFDPFFARFVRSVDFTYPRFASPDSRMRWPVLPETLQRDAQGNLHILDARNAMIVVFDRDMNYVRSYGEFGSGPGQLREPNDLAISPDGSTVYVVDTGNFRVQAYDMQGTPTLTFGEYGTGDGKFQRPVGIAVDRTGAVFVSDALSDRIQKFDATGQFQRAWGQRGLKHGDFWQPLGMAIDGRDRLFVIDHGNHRAQVFTLSGDWLGTFGAGKATMKSQLQD